MEEYSLSRLPDLPSYRSCYKNYGRSILPPVILPPDREKLEEYRSKASAVEARIIARKTVNDSFMETLQKLANGTFLQQDSHISIGDCLLVPESKPQSSNTTASISPSLPPDSSPVSCDMRNFRKGIYYEEIIDHDTSSSSMNSDLPKQTSNNFAVQCNLVEESMGMANRNKEDDSSNCSRISEDKVLSEVDDTEWSTSLPTVILKKNSQNDDENESVTSVNRSTDLDKYLDSSFDAETPTTIEEKRELVSNIASSTSGSTVTLNNSTRSSSPIVQPPSEIGHSDKSTLKCDTDVCSQLNSTNNTVKEDSPISNNSQFLIEPNTIVSDKHKDGVPETGNQKSWLRNLLDKAQKKAKDETKEISKSDGDDDTDTNTSFRPHHVRSNSYTLESPSPCLVLSHNGCKCEHSPEAISSPHCCSVPSDTDPAEIGGKLSENSHLSNDNAHNGSVQMANDDLKNNTSPSSITCNKIPHVSLNDNDTVDVNVTDQVFNDVPPSASTNESENQVPIETNLINTEAKSDPEIRHDLPIQEVYKMFVSMREKAFDDMHKDHVKQWKELSESFDMQEKKFLERLAFLSLNDSSTKSLLETSPRSVSAVSVQCQRPPKHDICMPISSVRSFIANNNTPKSDCQKRDIENMLSDPVMQKKFEKVSAAVKGYLTRRLWKSNVVQAIIISLKGCAQQIADIKHEVLKRGGVPTAQDISRHQKLFNQIKEIDSELQRIFFEMSMKERMELIADTREANKHKAKLIPQISLPVACDEPRKIKDHPSVPLHMRKLSSATIKALERKQLSSATENKFHSNPELQVLKKPLNARPHTRKRILSPRSCTVSPPSLRNFRKSCSPGKRSPGVNKVRRSLY